MFRILFAAAIVAAPLAAHAGGYHWVRPYTRDDGTYVQGHMQGNPDGNPWNNLNPPRTYEPPMPRLNMPPMGGTGLPRLPRLGGGLDD